VDNSLIVGYRYRFWNNETNQWHGWIYTEKEPKKLTTVYQLEPLYRSLDFLAEIDKLKAENERLNQIINTPQSNDFLRAVSIEAEHQRQRWGTKSDKGKTPTDWLWLIGYLAGKAVNAQILGNKEKTEHHIITTAGACENWHLALMGKTDMRPGIDGEAVLDGRAEGKI
jgi:hypothetical protein